jgi:hypothetical protein
MVSPPRDFESRASTNFATPATKIKDITLLIVRYFKQKVNGNPKGVADEGSLIKITTMIKYYYFDSILRIFSGGAYILLLFLDASVAPFSIITCFFADTFTHRYSHPAASDCCYKVTGNMAGVTIGTAKKIIERL